jgi:hypothetical protein
VPPVAKPCKRDSRLAVRLFPHCICFGVGVTGGPVSSKFLATTRSQLPSWDPASLRQRPPLRFKILHDPFRNRFLSKAWGFCLNCRIHHYVQEEAAMSLLKKMRVGLSGALAATVTAEWSVIDPGTDLR